MVEEYVVENEMEVNSDVGSALIIWCRREGFLIRRVGKFW